MKIPKSIRELGPLETGGPDARRGFLFQDHVAAGFCLRMVLSVELLEVWCETADDVTLIWSGEEGEEVEFIQVKAEEVDQLYSPAMLCATTTKKGGTRGKSVLEKLMANDRCEEPVSFRMVTRRPPMGELKVLIQKVGSENRAEELMDALEEELESRLSNLSSPNGNGIRWWAERTGWDSEHSEEALQNKNIRLLERVLERLGHFLVSDQKEALYERLLQSIIKASAANKKVDLDAGKLTRADIIEFIHDAAAQIEDGGAVAGGRDLAAKMERASIDEEAIANARALRMGYRATRLRPDYLEFDNLRECEDQVRARLQRLRASLDCGDIEADGVKFHSITLNELEELRKEYPEGKRPSEQYIAGYMYFITDVCQHRFERASI